MKRTKAYKELKGRTGADLEKAHREYRDRLWTLTADLAAGKVKNVREIRSIRRTIAQILTLRNSKQAVK
jgi:ribosomal protein L29